jgi:hypothetical protein
MKVLDEEKIESQANVNRDSGTINQVSEIEDEEDGVVHRIVGLNMSVSNYRASKLKNRTSVFPSKSSSRKNSP